MPVTDRRGRQAGRKAQAPSDNQVPAYCCRPVHTGAISKRLASVTRQGSPPERFIAWRSVNGEGNLSLWRHLYMLGMGCPGITVSTTPSFAAQVSLQFLCHLTRRKRLVKACRLSSAPVCNRHNNCSFSVIHIYVLYMQWLFFYELYTGWHSPWECLDEPLPDWEARKVNFTLEKLCFV